MTSSVSQWKPSADIRTHKGDFIPPNLIFFTPPPSEIVNLCSAASTLETGKPTKKIDSFFVINKIGAAVCFAFVGGIVTFLAVALPLAGSLGSQSGNIGLIAALIVSGIILFLMLRGEWKLPTTCSYVGDNGIASYASAKETNAKHGTGLFLFHLFKFELIQQELKQNSTVTFKLQKNDKIIVSQNYIELIQKGNNYRLNAEEIDKVNISKGVINIIPKEIRNGFFGFARDGILRIPYKNIANARIFILVFDMLINQK